MKTRQTPMFPRIRLLMMLFMLLSMAGSWSLTASAAPDNTGNGPAASWQDVQLCVSLAGGDLHLSPAEAESLAQDLDGDQDVDQDDIDLLLEFCGTVQSMTAGGGPNVTICHATGADENNPYVMISPAAAAVLQGHYGEGRGDHQDGDDIIPSFTYNGTTYAAQGDQSWLARDCAPPPPPPDTYTLTLAKYFCVIDDEEQELLKPMIGDPSQYDCVAATDQEFALSLAGYEYTTAELLAGVDLEPGEYDVYEGETYVGTVEIVDEDVFRNVLNFVPDEDEGDGRVTILKRFCEFDNSPNENSNCNGRLAPDVDVTFNVYEGEGTEGTMIGTIVVTEFDQGNGSQGTAESNLPLVVGETYTVCEVPPTGWDAVPRPGQQGGSNQTGSGDCIIVELGPGNNVLQFNNFPDEEEEPGKAVVIKYFCTDEDITVPVVGDEGDYEGCELATAEQLEGVNFWVYPNGVEADAIDIDDSALLGDGVELPDGTHTLVEEFDGAIHELSDLPIVAGQTTTIMVFNPVPEEEVTINIYKLVCSGFSEAHEDGCVESDELDGTEIDFTVTYTIGEDDTTVYTSLVVEEFEGSATLTLPLADSYTVCEDTPDGVEEVTFGVIGVDDAESTADGCITFSGEGLVDGDVVELVFWNDLEDEKPVTPEKPEKPTPPKKPTVTTLPDTGSGTVDDGSMAPWMLIASAAVLAGTGALLRKERPAA